MTEAAAREERDPLRRGAPPGSLRYFSVLFAPADRRPLLGALYALEAELRDTVDSASHDVAHSRLQWWRAEVDRYAAGRPQHPVTRALQGLRECAAHDPALLHEALAAADLDLARMTYVTQGELEAYAFRSSGSLQTLVAAALAGPRALSPAERGFARDLGLALRQTEILRDLVVDGRRGRLYVPLDLLQGAGIDPAAILAAPADALRAVIDPWRLRLSESLLRLPDGLTATERVVQRPGLVLGALLVRLLARIDPARTSPQGRADVPALSRLWTAWSTAVRYS